MRKTLFIISFIALLLSLIVSLSSAYYPNEKRYFNPAPYFSETETTVKIYSYNNFPEVRYETIYRPIRYTYTYQKPIVYTTYSHRSNYLYFDREYRTSSMMPSIPYKPKGMYYMQMDNYNPIYDDWHLNYYR